MKGVNSLESSLLKKNYHLEALECSTSRIEESMLSSTCGEATILESLKKI